MQKWVLKYFGIVALFLNLQTFAATTFERLVNADSLFAHKKYAEAYTEYKALFDNGHFTPKMLLKMAYVKEGMGDVPEALFYLDTYYVNFPAQNILKKMESLAKSKNIGGYDYDDLNYFLYLYSRYKAETMIALVAILFLFFLAIVSNRVIFKRIPVTSPYLFLFLAAFVYAFVNYSEKFFYKGIVTKDRALIMDNPSAGAHVLTILPKGTRFPVWTETDIWYKIKWEGKTGYIRKANLHLTSQIGDTNELLNWL
jgi:hypothetical protein